MLFRPERTLRKWPAWLTSRPRLNGSWAVSARFSSEVSWKCTKQNSSSVGPGRQRSRVLALRVTRAGGEGPAAAELYDERLAALVALFAELLGRSGLGQL